MDLKYTNDKSTQILIALLKAHGIRKVVASPGTTNAIFVTSIQHDDFFQVFSSVDERSAAYIACGLAQESLEPVVITCTEATASRNYFSGLTEAFYRKLPILAVTGFHELSNIGNLCTQAIDRSRLPQDIVRYSTTIERCRTKNDEWKVNFQINKAILELTHHGGGPVHINLQIGGRWDFFDEILPSVRVIKRIGYKDDRPLLPHGKIAIVIGAHKRFSKEETDVIDRFCDEHNAAVFADVVSGYYGKYRINVSVIGAQRFYESPSQKADLTIHLGEVGWSSAKSKQTWRVSEDGEVRDTFHNLTYVFEMSEKDFFESYQGKVCENTYYNEIQTETEDLVANITEMPLSNAWIAYNTINLLPHNCVFHMGILNSFRVWNYFKFDESIDTHCNFGGFGIDGGLSTLLGASFVNPTKLYFGVFGDLAFFYDMNCLGNRHLGRNVRIMLINNGKGNEFRNNIHPASKLGDEGDLFVAAAGHYGNKSNLLVKHYAEDLGFRYLSASTKEEFKSVINEFTKAEITDRPILFEIFTTTESESKSLDMLSMLKQDNASSAFGRAKQIVRNYLSDKTVFAIKRIMK